MRIERYKNGYVVVDYYFFTLSKRFACNNSENLNWFYHVDYLDKHCKVDTLREAIELLDRYNVKLVKVPKEDIDTERLQIQLDKESNV